MGATRLPDLCLVNDATWDAVQHRLGALRGKAGADAPDRNGYWERRRAVHLLTHKVHCGRCGGVMSNISRDYLACAAARRQGVCGSTRGIRRQVLDRLILDALRERMMDPALFAEFARAFVEEWNRATAEADAGRDGLVRELGRVERKLRGLIEAVSDGFRAAGLQDQMATLEARRLELTAGLATAAPAQPRLQPALPDLYRSRMEHLQEALEGDADDRNALELVRGLIERIELHPLAGGGFEVEVGEIANARPRCYLLIVLCSRVRQKLVAGTGFEPVTFRL